MKYFIVIIVAVLVFGCSKDEDPVSIEGNEPFVGIYLYNGTGIFDSVASTGGYSRFLGAFNLNGDYDSLYYSFAVKTNSNSSSVSFRSDSLVFIYYICQNFIGDSNFHSYSYKILKPSDEIAYTRIILATGFRKYLVVKDLKVYMK